MDSQQTFSLLLERLDYGTSPNLISRGTSGKKIPPELEVLWSEMKEKLQLDAVYFIANVPVIYFKRFESFDREIVANFHLNVWNQSRIPLIFVILPNDIRIYNGYEAPQRTGLGYLSEPSRIDNKVSPSNDVWKRLELFNRIAIESGSFWRDFGHLFHRETRADQTLIANLRYIRRQMIEETGLSPEHTHSLIGRSIFAFYLQDRGVLPVGKAGFFAQVFKKSYTRYTDILTSYEDTYTFFEILRMHFNGDMFPVTEEEKKAVNHKHLILLHKLFTVDSQAGGQLLFFWAYNFAFIPIELISSIYEEFLYQEESGKNGAYYTPPLLVYFMLDQVMPWSDLNYKLRLLDPACGSGIFLVEAYRRLVERWRKIHKEKPSFKVLSEILATSIFGVDIKRQALRVAAFSLYLAMLDYLEPKRIWVDAVFPSLIGTNLIEADFFNEEDQLDRNSFDLIIGNPPWESQLTSHAKSFLLKRGLKVGDKQIVQAFLWHVPDFCTQNGQIALLCSSKSLLFNKSGPNVSFRKDFFNRFNVKIVFDFSALRRFLFEKGIAPATAIFYTPKSPPSKSIIFYGAPKLTPLTRLLASIVIEANDLKQLPLQQVLNNIDIMEREKNQTLTEQKALFPYEEDEENEEDDEESEVHSVNIWKVALWGTKHDYTLLQALNNFPSLGEVIKMLDWDSGSGFIRNGPGESKHYPWLDNAFFLEAKDLTRYGIDRSKLKSLPKHALYHRGRIAERFKGPLVLFKRGQAQRRPSAAYIDFDCTYTNSITGITGSDRNLLKALTALLNSELAQYYLFLTSSSWEVEREEIKPGEMKTLPFPFLAAKVEHLDAIAELVDILGNNIIHLPKRTQPDGLWRNDNQKWLLINEAEQKINDLIYQCFLLDEKDIKLIRETVQYTIGFFNSPENSLAQQKPSIEMQFSYAESYIGLINFYLKPIGRKLNATVYNVETALSPLLVVQFSSKLLDENVPNVQIAHSNEQMQRALSGLQKLNMEPLSRRMYHKRNFRIYDRTEDTLSIIKPAEQRLWTMSAALDDAEETVAELSQSIRV